MARKRVTDSEPYNFNPHIKMMYELPFGNDLIKPGDKVRIKNQRSTFEVYQFAYHSESAVTWVDCRNTATGSYHSFYVHKIRNVVRPKKSIRKKLI